MSWFEVNEGTLERVTYGTLSFLNSFFVLSIVPLSPPITLTLTCSRLVLCLDINGDMRIYSEY
jgi:hypothetical protein